MLDIGTKLYILKDIPIMVIKEINVDKSLLVLEGEETVFFEDNRLLLADISGLDKDIPVKELSTMRLRYLRNKESFYLSQTLLMYNPVVFNEYNLMKVTVSCIKEKYLKLKIIKTVNFGDIASYKIIQ